MMTNKIIVGNIETIEHDKQAVALTKKVLRLNEQIIKQNNAILGQNKMIVKMFTDPPIMAKKDKSWIN